jgi:4-azaleucine resistance transporter AzlC
VRLPGSWHRSGSTDRPYASHPGPAAELAAGVRGILPLLVGVAPFGLIYGVLARSSGVPAPAAMAMSSVLFAGSAQFLLAQLVAVGAPALVMVSSVGLVNLRHALYSASVAPELAHLGRGWKVLLAYLLTDEAYAVAITRYRRDSSPHRHWYFLGVGATLWACWQISTACGIVLGAQIPRSLPLDFALPLTFIAMVVPMIRTRAAVISASVAGGVALLGVDWPLRLGFLGVAWPYKLGLLAAALTGIFSGWIAERLLRRSP